LEWGKLVITDRQWASSVAYQVFGRNLFYEEATLGLKLAGFSALNDFFAYDVYPDLNILIDVPVEVAQARARSEADKSRFDVEDRKFHERVRNGYLQLAFKKIKGDWLVFDGTQSVEMLHEEIYQKLMEWLKNKKEEKE
jgi:dTMP kinase